MLQSVDFLPAFQFLGGGIFILKGDRHWTLLPLWKYPEISFSLTLQILQIGKPKLLLQLFLNLNNVALLSSDVRRDMTKPAKWLCAQRRLRSAWASAQSDQSLRCPHEGSLGPELPNERTAKTLIRLGRCPGWSESSLGAHSFCWFCHVTAHLQMCPKSTGRLATSVDPD